MRIITFEVTEKYAGKSVKSVMEGPLQISRGLISRLKRREDGICVNDKKVYTNYLLNQGDTLSINVEDRKEIKHLTPIKMSLVIAYEDEDILIVDKPSNIAVHPTKNQEEISLEQGLVHYLSGKSYPHFVNRLDKGTSGLLMVAKSGYVHELMKRRLHTNAFYREYIAVADGYVLPRNGIINAPIGYLEGSSYKHCVRPDGANSCTVYETISNKNERTLLRLKPETGRTHQLRVHMAYLGFPLTGDWLYGKRSEEICRQALHSYQLRFIHPIKEVTIECFSKIPEDIQKLIL